MKWIINKGSPPPNAPSALADRDTCPNLANHLYGPHPYLEWHQWALAMERRGYDQSKCPDCGFFMIWEKVRKAA